MLDPQLNYKFIYTVQLKKILCSFAQYYCKTIPFLSNYLNRQHILKWTKTNPMKMFRQCH